VHELSIANAILDAVREERARLNAARVIKVGVRIGELAGVDPEALSFGFEVLVKDTDLEPLRLEIEFTSRRYECSQCGHVFTVVDYQVDCPDCGAADTRCIGGDELELAYLEVEDS
jgi:hydrogenase nickel incorporation protein HypA/HybF